MDAISFPHRNTSLAATMTALLGTWIPVTSVDSCNCWPVLHVQQSDVMHSQLTQDVDINYATTEKTVVAKQWKTNKSEFIKAISDLSTPGKNALGQYGVSRLSTFSDYPTGWAGGNGQALSHLSLAVLDSFLQHRPHFDTEPSVFMTKRGTIELSWETKTGSSINLEFFPNRIEYFIESEGEEGDIPPTHDELSNLALRLTNEVRA